MIEYLPLVLTGLGIIVSILYYTNTLAIANKARRKDIIFQSHIPRTPEYYEIFSNVVQMRDYNTRKEYEEKYTAEARALGVTIVCVHITS